MSKKKIASELAILIVNFISENEMDSYGQNFNENLDTALTVIISDSIQSINFVTLIEGEFGLEFDDDDISLDNFSSFENLVNLLIKY